MVIYIPLCLYLYSLYISTSCLTCWFTFHYVYIYICVHDSVSYNSPNLHSTMFIFILRISKIWLGMNGNLHSTMFIFICLPLFFRKRGKDKFTFHYVYIYMRLEELRAEQRAHLHSTMFIFISCLCTIHLLPQTFTFHYVYIYIARGYHSEYLCYEFTFHYVYIYMVAGCVSSSGQG